MTQGRTLRVDAAKLDAGKELFTVAEVAAILSLSKRTVESLIAHGFLRSGVAPGTDRTRRVSRTMIEEYVDAFNGTDSRPRQGKRK